MFPIETKQDRDKGVGILKKSGFWKSWEVPWVGLSGGLLLGWLLDWKLTILHISKHLIHTDLLDHKGTPLSITFIYGQPELSKREKVWLELKHLKHLARTN